MGHIKTTELANGNIGLEITYGGNECPFGGVDTSAPPAYIDPKCFTDCDGFIIVDNKLVAVNMAPVSAPPLWSGTTGVSLIGFGNFYSIKYGTLNYALGYTAIAVSGTPTGVQYTFYMTAWSPSNPTTYWNDTLVETLYNSVTPATAASITMALQTISTGTVGTGAVIDITALESYGTNVIGEFFLPGIVAGLSIVSGGSNYTVGTQYWLMQDSNLTAQVQIESVANGSGAITGLSIVPGTYLTHMIYPTNNSALFLATAGFGYNTTDTATLVYIQANNVELQVSGPGGSNTYSALVNSASLQVPSYSGSGAVLYVRSMVNNDGNIYTDSINPSGKYGAVLSVSQTTANYPGPSSGGTNYAVGQVYYFQQYTYTPDFPTDPVATGDGTVQVMITGVGAGGAVTDFNIINSGTSFSNYTTVLDGYNGALALPPTNYIGYLTTPVPVLTVASGPANILNTLATAINYGGVNSGNGLADQYVSASVLSLSTSLVLTALFPGAQGNLISVQDLSTITGSLLYYYYFPVRTLTYLTGGNDGSGSGTVLSTLLPSQASITSVGGTLYIGNIGPLVIKYSGPGAFAISSTAQGIRVLRKFADSLIGLGLIPAPATIIASTDMIFAWTAAEALDVWNAVDISGNITGAGFNQLADIGDYLSGLVVSGGTAFILRAQGISYATATGNATQPFNWAHIGLGDQGEGAQVAALACQYDQTGMYVGNSDVYQVSNTITSIGSKIKALIYNALDSVAQASSSACAVWLGGDSFPLIVFCLGLELFIYSPNNGTWMLYVYQTTPYQNYLSLQNVIAGSLATYNTHAGEVAVAGAMFALALQNYQTHINIGLQAPIFYTLQEGLVNIRSLYSVAQTVTFIQEEIAFGRDITVDGLYIALFADVTETVTVDFYISGQFFNSLTLTPAQFNTLSGVPVEVQLSSPTGSFTVHSPQLSFTLSPSSTPNVSQIRFTKFAMFGSFDPKQRPV